MALAWYLEMATGGAPAHCSLESLTDSHPDSSSTRTHSGCIFCSLLRPIAPLYRLRQMYNYTAKYHQYSVLFLYKFRRRLRSSLPQQLYSNNKMQLDTIRYRYLCFEEYHCWKAVALRIAHTHSRLVSNKPLHLHMHFPLLHTYTTIRFDILHC